MSVQSGSLNNSYAGGILLALIGGIILSVDIPLFLLAVTDPMTLIAVRGTCQVAIMLFVWWILWVVFKKRMVLIGGHLGALAIVFYSLTTLFFVFAVYNTSTANLVFILAFNPMFSALLGWWLLGERPSNVTLIAVFATLIGVAIIVGDGIRLGTWFGDLLSVLAVIGLSFALILNRSIGKTAVFLPGLGYGVSALVALPFATWSFDAVEHWEWLLLNSLILMPLSSAMLAASLKIIPATEVAMFYLLETVLTPIWVWLIFNDTPSFLTLIGGCIITLTIFLHAVWMIRESRRNSALKRRNART